MNAGSSIRIQRPFNYQRLLVWITVLFALLSVSKLLYPIILRVVTNQKLWASGSIIFILTMISGFMWNQIRHPPYVANDGNKIQYIMPGFQNQCILETQIVTAMYGVIGFLLIALIYHPPRISNPSTQRLAVYGYLFAFVAAYSYLIGIFSLKHQGYPFKLF
jgi:oligosaccharyltransferase complex subunit gamma